jgi:hypothetical protein
MAISDGTELVLLNPVFSPNTFAPVVASATNTKCSVTSASASATFTADEIVVKTALGGSPYTLASYSKTVNLGSTGAGGMDTGSAPANGYVSLYAIYGASGTSILACNVTTSATSIYGGSNMPSGYTYSALIGIWPTNGSSQFPIGYQIGKSVYFASVNVLNSEVSETSYTSLGISSAVPPTAKSCSGFVGSPTSEVQNAISLAADANGTGEQCIVVYPAAWPSDGNYASAPFSVPIVTAQTVYYKTINNAGEYASNSINITGYTF